jgi:hypothetical protein
LLIKLCDDQADVRRIYVAKMASGLLPDGVYVWPVI